MKRRCYVCKEIKELELFAKDSSCTKGYKYRCKKCHNCFNRSKSSGSMGQEYLSKYDELLKRQDGKCAICGRIPSKRHFAIDHNHKTDVVRGLLCHSCNVGLGHFRDSVELLEAAKVYLKKENIAVCEV